MQKMCWYLLNLKMTKTNKFGEIIFNEHDLFDLVMSGTDLLNFSQVPVDPPVDLSSIADITDSVPKFQSYCSDIENLPVEQYDRERQQRWFMPVEYQQLDIAKHVLELCQTDAELQRVAQELLMYQERNLFDLLRYLKYLVDTMRQNQIIWGVGRGSSLASYVLYLMGIHRIDSMLYELDPAEFLR
jgi:DNA polymerase III alpha subunit